AHDPVVPVPAHLRGAGADARARRAAFGAVRVPALGTGLARGLARDVPADLDLVDRRGREPADADALFLRHVGERETLLEVDSLLLDLRRDEHEIVRVQVAADVRVRQEALVRGVAHALEAVELEAPERVDR